MAGTLRLGNLNEPRGHKTGQGGRLVLGDRVVDRILALALRHRYRCGVRTRIATALSPRAVDVSSPRARRRLVLAAITLFAVIFAVRWFSHGPELGLSFLFVVPIVIVSITIGIGGAAAGTVGALALSAIWALAKDIPLGLDAYVVRFIVFAFAGLAAALFSRMTQNLAEQTAAWFEQDLDLHCIASPDGRFVRVNEAFVRTLGYSRDELVAKPFVEFVHQDDRDSTIAETMMLAERLGDSVNFENRYVTKEGTYRWLRWSATTVTDGSIFASARDVTEQKELQVSLEKLATTDPLTGLPNRRLFEQEADRILAHIARHGRTVTAMMMDLDGFKAVNDTIGHHAGDEVLVRVASALRERFRASDLLARLGGDEFIMLLPEVSRAGAEVVATDVLSSVRTCGWRGSGGHAPVSGSIGVAVAIGPRRDDLATLVQRPTKPCTRRSEPAAIGTSLAMSSARIDQPVDVTSPAFVGSAPCIPRLENLEARFAQGLPGLPRGVYESGDPGRWLCR